MIVESRYRYYVVFQVGAPETCTHTSGKLVRNTIAGINWVTPKAVGLHALNGVSCCVPPLGLLRAPILLQLAKQLAKYTALQTHVCGRAISTSGVSLIEI